MSYTKPTFRHPEARENRAGYRRRSYEGAISTLCAGCGHDSISNAIITACFEMNLEPHRIVKLSGIGCSSKTPAYFLGKSHGFNSVHGRMPSVATGANMANRDLVCIGVSGDGDTASIGMGQFAHVARRNLDMVYVVMNNGCYGLTKGQDSATADKGSKTKKGDQTSLESIDLCELAIQLGAGFVGRGFSGDKQQVVTMLKAAIAHKGLAFLDIISPCVTFNNVSTSTK
ncbi:MAG: 2-oxoacid:ferredoxin oxidoreductase subunit beta, partial [Thermodesulfobacteriota bacterium]